MKATVDGVSDMSHIPYVHLVYHILGVCDSIRQRLVLQTNGRLLYVICTMLKAFNIDREQQIKTSKIVRKICECAFNWPNYCHKFLLESDDPSYSVSAFQFAIKSHASASEICVFTTFLLHQRKLCIRFCTSTKSRP